MKFLMLSIFMGIQALGFGQASEVYQVSSTATMNGQVVELDGVYINSNNDSIQFSKVKYYLSRIELQHDRDVLFTENQSYHLIDFEKPETQNWELHIPENRQSVQISFQLGIDSLTNVSGAMGGDLDPTLGMYWTWQSGYINVKLEGKINNQEFSYHLGGYSGDQNAVQRVLSAEIGARISIELELSALFSSEIYDSVMSPGIQAVSMSKIIVESIRIHE